MAGPGTSRAHVPVLLEEVVGRLLPSGRGVAPRVIVDCTAGLGGHAAALVRQTLVRQALVRQTLDPHHSPAPPAPPAPPAAPVPPLASAPGPAGAQGAPGAKGEVDAPTLTAVLFDLDPLNLQRASAHVQRASAAGCGGAGVRVLAVHANFAEVPRRLAEAGLRADVVLADLGFASNQVDDAARGLSFSRDGPLDMRLDTAAPFSAADLVASGSASELERVIRDYGEERYARAVARRIVEARREAPILTTGRLAEIVRSAVPPSPPRGGGGGGGRGGGRGGGGGGGGGGIDPATRTFQALRIAVNDELGNLSALLDAVERAAQALRRGDGASWLAPGAAVGIIAFHSLEDRPVKQAFARLVAAGLAEDLTSGPVTAGEEECRANPRARSAKFRAVRLT